MVRMPKGILDADNILASPYDVNRTPLPTTEELALLGVQIKSADKAIAIGTKVQPEVVYAIDRLIEQRVYKIKSRHDFIRLAVMNLVATLEGEIQSEYVQALVRRLEDQRRMAAELHRLKDVVQMVASTRQVVGQLISWGDLMSAIRALRNAKRFGEEINTEAIRRRYINLLYGSVDGEKRPDDWETHPDAVLWDRVLSGELDKDDEAELNEKIKVF